MVRKAWIGPSEVVSLENPSAMSDRRRSDRPAPAESEIDPAKLMARYREIVDGYGVVTDK